MKNVTNETPSVLSLHSKNAFLEILPEKGGCITRYCLKDNDNTIEILRPANPTKIIKGDPLEKASFPLIPFSNRIRRGKFTFQGIDELNQPFYLHAKEYQRIVNSKNKLLFVKPSAEINLKQAKWLTMNAEKGVFDIEKQTLELIGNVLFLHSDGEQIDTNNAIIDLKNAKIYGNKKIFGKNETISFSSEGFEVQKTVKNFQLLGKSKINIKNIK